MLLIWITPPHFMLAYSVASMEIITNIKDSEIHFAPFCEATARVFVNNFGEST